MEGRLKQLLSLENLFVEFKKLFNMFKVLLIELIENFRKLFTPNHFFAQLIQPIIYLNFFNFSLYLV